MTQVVGAETITPKLAAIRALTAAGYVLIPLCSNRPEDAHEHWTDGGSKSCKTPGKVPVGKNWQQTKPGQHSEADLMTGNYGVLLQAGDVVVDIDPRNFTPGDSPVKRLSEEIGAPLKSFMTKTGGGGYHIFLRKPADVLVRNSLKEFPGIEFKSAGRQVVGPGSVHHSGKMYEAASGNIQEIAEAPARLLALISRPAPTFDDVGTGAYVNDAPTQGRFLDYLQHQAPTSGSYAVACKGRDLGLPPSVTLELMMETWNPRRVAPRPLDEMKLRVEHAYKYAKGAVGSSHPSAAFDTIVIEAPPKKEEEAPLAWNTGPQGQLLKTFNNLMNFMRSPEPRHGLRHVFAYNEFTGRNEFVAAAPWHKGRFPKFPGVGDTDLKLLKGHLAVNCGFDSTVQTIEEAVTNVAYRERFHPVRDFLNKLEWDGKPRLNSWMRDFLGAVDGGYPEYLEAVSWKILTAAVLRALHPGIPFHHVPVLEGPQDLGKSGTVEILGGDWSSDSPIDPHNRDTVDQMQGRWFCEMAEMEQLRKVDEDALKAFITRRTDRVRLAYGRSTGEFPRQSVFIATKNPGPDGTYLKDTTGNRRWWPVRLAPAPGTNGLGQIDFKGLQAARNQLFAEAVVRARGIKHHRELSMDTPLLKEQAKLTVAQRHAEHEWTEAIASWIERCDRTPETRKDFLTTREIFGDALMAPDRALDRKSTLAVAEVMRGIGWRPHVQWIAGRSVRGYTRTPAAASAPTLDDVAALL